MNYVQKLGDDTSKEVKPDFDSGKGDTWMKMISDSRQNTGQEHNPLLPYRPRKGLKEECFWGAVDLRLSRKSFSMGVSFDENGILHRPCPYCGGRGCPHCEKEQP
jgi:hypothetical protein